MAGVWGALGRLLATFGRIVLAFWAFKAISFKALVQDELQKAFWIDFGRIWHGFGEDFDRIWVGSWEDSASFLEGLWKDLEKILKKIVDGVRPFFRVFSQLGPPRCFASPREAPQCAGVRRTATRVESCSNGFSLIRAHMDSLVLFHSCYSSLGA